MLFNSVEFIFIFLPVLSVLFWLVQRSNKIALLVLLLGSLCFYAYHSLSNLFLMLASVLFNFFIGRHVLSNKLILVFGVSVNICLLAYFKYSFFILENINTIMPVPIYFEKIVLPLGISFFTFQQIAYLVDNYHGNKPENNIVPYALLVSFFPHAIAGPIVQYKEIAPQFQKVIISIENFSIGGTIFIIGLFKKIVIADGLAPCVNSVFDLSATGVSPSFVEAWFGAIGYTLQLYFDFSGYSDMAVGLARIFNVHFPVNFDSPYKSKSIIDFWRRWHMTLSSFLKNYLYVPMGGNRKGALSRYKNIIVTMLIGGLWHGANWTFVLWGVLHGIYLVINHAWRDRLKKRGLVDAKKKQCLNFGWVITAVCVIFAWVLFRSLNLSSAFVMYKSMLGFNGVSVSPKMIGVIPNYFFIEYQGFFKHVLFDVFDYFPLMISAVLICLYLPNMGDFLKYFMNDGHRSVSMDVFHARFNISSLCWMPSRFYAVLMAMMTVWIILALLSARKLEFLYFNF